jgi:hypothetical protein
MAYILYYNLEFDTVKGRRVKLEIEKERNIVSPQVFQPFAVSVFSSSDNSLETNQKMLDFLEVGDIITITGTANNNKTFTLKDFVITPANPGLIFGSTKLFFNEAVVNESDSSYTMTISVPPYKDIQAFGQSPIELSYPNGEFEKMNPIRESKMRIKILTKNVNYENFTILYDTQYKVKLYVNDTLEWLGWLDNDLITEPFLDVPVEMELSANDGLSILKTTDLQTQSGDQMWGLYRMKEFIANALYRTKLDLDFVSFINMYPESTLERDSVVPASYDWDAFFFSQIYATTFLKGPRDFDDCYQVLSKIMQSFGCTLFQARGKWYIVQTNDRIANVLDGTIRDYTGAATGIAMNQNFAISVGLNEITKLINADALVSIEKPFKEVAIKHKFDVPPTYFRNFDLLDLAADAYSGVAPAYWTAVPQELNQYGYINQGEVFVDLEAGTNAEIRRGLKFQGGSTTRPSGAKRSTLYPVNKGDEINFSYSVKYNIPYFKFSGQWCYVLFVSESGQQYYMDDVGLWIMPGNPPRAIGPAYVPIGYNYNRNEDRRFWKTVSKTSKPVPGNGTISIILTGRPQILEDGFIYDVFFKDIEFSVKTSFNELTEVDGYEQKSDASANLKNKFDAEIFIANAPNISTQGSLLRSNFINAANWKYKGGSSPIMPFAKYITRAYWRTMWRNFMRIEGRLYDLYQGSRLLSPLNSIEFTEVEDKEFMLTTLQMDIRQETSEFTMIELRDTSNTNDFTQNGNETFRYLNARAKDENDPIKEPKTPIDWRFGPFGVLSSLIRRSKRRRFNNYS